MLDALADDGQRYEIIDGELFVTSSPIEVHQLIVTELARRLGNYVIPYRTGKVLVSPSDVWRGERRRNRVQPDVYVVRVTNGRRPPYPFHLRDLLLAVEVVSPASWHLDYVVKRDLYLREGVGEYWVIDSDARNVTRWRDREYAGETFTDRITWTVTGSDVPFELDLPEFFDEALR